MFNIALSIHILRPRCGASDTVTSSQGGRGVGLLSEDVVPDDGLPLVPLWPKGQTYKQAQAINHKNKENGPRAKIAALQKARPPTSSHPTHHRHHHKQYTRN